MINKSTYNDKKKRILLSIITFDIKSINISRYIFITFSPKLIFLAFF